MTGNKMLPKKLPSGKVHNSHQLTRAYTWIISPSFWYTANIL